MLMSFGLTPHKVPAILHALHPCYASLKIGNYNALKFKQHGKWTEHFGQIAYWETVYCFAFYARGLFVSNMANEKVGHSSLAKELTSPSPTARHPTQNSVICTLQ